jgi:hypothetical protein
VVKTLKDIFIGAFSDNQTVKRCISLFCVPDFLQQLRIESNHNKVGYHDDIRFVKNVSLQHLQGLSHCRARVSPAVKCHRKKGNELFEVVVNIG